MDGSENELSNFVRLCHEDKCTGLVILCVGMSLLTITNHFFWGGTEILTVTPYKTQYDTHYLGTKRNFLNSFVETNLILNLIVT